MRFAGTPEFLPPDARRDNFYLTRYGDRGTISHINWFRSQGLYGLGWKTPHTQSIYPYWYGSPGQSTIDESSKPWPRPLRFFQGLAHPWRPVGMYYQMGSYVPIFDLDPVAPGPGPYPIRSTSTGTTAADRCRGRGGMRSPTNTDRQPFAPRTPSRGANGCLLDQAGTGSSTMFGRGVLF